ncbi:hypothetical protein QAD02_003294 [Eretmocerus hayati]|uniref:Uncharacterized protein n=1 Tax=Eretmocerus hayati TaxID=131215 RepID=A0ACC2NLG3_9HYME|nr:hypothetical protein QAD02_003294 [Eretmocerus hayati]
MILIEELCERVNFATHSRRTDCEYLSNGVELLVRQRLAMRYNKPMARNQSLLCIRVSLRAFRVNMEKAILINAIISTLKFATTHDPHVKTMCGFQWRSDLKLLTIDILRRKLSFLLLHCSYRTINNLYKSGMLGRECIIPVVCEVLKKKYGLYSDFKDLVDLVNGYTAQKCE